MSSKTLAVSMQWTWTYDLGIQQTWDPRLSLAPTYGSHAIRAPSRAEPLTRASRPQQPCKWTAGTRLRTAAGARSPAPQPRSRCQCPQLRTPQNSLDLRHYSYCTDVLLPTYDTTLTFTSAARSASGLLGTAPSETLNGACDALLPSLCC